ncbi:hypothetical protein [Gilliamella intestini]|uniref:Uncharacterized protein n=1 Tax=Gilliamella intestini TaxID=1798183 RepID=A0A1C4DTD6_9GAMM|nr:hypothetical protein [Gilliamella intestini]SCC34531.1 hypothetical protein GA0061080_11052 [Gilliamella intestini]
MKIKLDITKKVTETLDTSGISSLITYIDIPLYRDVCNDLKFNLFHFTLNLDNEIISVLNKKDNPKFHNLNEDIILLIKQAHVKFGKIKGMDVAMFGTNKKPFESCYQTWPYNLDKKDEIYEIYGFSINLPYGGMVLNIVSNNPVTVTFELNECELYTEYLAFSNRTSQLNALMDTPLPRKGQSFIIKN